ncbi:hypothetical protein ACFVJ8_02270 [Streptomyces yangpuensis]|uniref:hypothetical protein n=1 Tax=Streptomyces TaxID=1883 RepID=UPI00131B9F24|nr:hypothetical protein [Streptomyces sp. NRRL S-378]
MTALLGIVLGRTVLPVPSLLGGSGDFFLSALVTVAPAVVWLHGTGRTALATEATALRPVHRWDVALAAALSAAALAVTAVAHLLASDDIALTVGRNITFYLAIAMLLSTFVGQRIAAPLITAIPIVLAVAGWRGRFPQPWAVVLHPGESHRALAATVALMAVASAVSAYVGPDNGISRAVARR